MDVNVAGKYVRTYDTEPPVLCRVPVFFLFSCSGDNDIASVLHAKY